MGTATPAVEATDSGPSTPAAVVTERTIRFPDEQLAKTASIAIERNE
jgi:hypothetical protein